MSEPLLHPDFNEKAWQERRLEIMTASLAAVVWGKHPFKTAEEVQKEKLGMAPPDVMSIQMERGRIFEPLAVERFVEKTGRPVEPIGLQVHPHHPLIGATADRKLPETDEDPEGVLEIKVPMWQTYARIKRYGLPEYIGIQAQLEAAVVGVDATTIGVWDTQSLELLHWDIEAIPQLQADMIGQIEDWWLRHIINREPVEIAAPLEDLPVVKGDVSRRDDEAFALLGRDYVFARDVEKEAKDQKDSARDALIELLKQDGHGTYEGSGVRVYFQKRDGGVTHKSTVNAIRGVKPLDPSLVQQELAKKLVDFPGIEEYDVIEILKDIAPDVRLDISALEKRGRSYNQLQVYRIHE